MIIIDLETTGLDPRVHSIVSIAAVHYNNPTKTFYRECRIEDGKTIAAEALAINGFLEDVLRDSQKPSVESCVKELMDWLPEGEIIAGQDPWFDKKFLLDICERYNIDWKLGRRAIDLHSLCFAEMFKQGLVHDDENPNLSLDKVLQFLGLQRSAQTHNALEDVLLEREAFKILLEGKRS